MSVLRVLGAGALTTVQDGGRPGWRHLGVGLAGALDPVLAAIANRMVGNSTDAAVLEITMTGPTLAFDQPVRIAMCGGGIDGQFEDTNNTLHVIPNGRPVTLPAGRLRLGTTRNGLRAWLAITGGIDVPLVLGSRSTDLRGSFGGLEGRALRVGDLLPLGSQPHINVDIPDIPDWWIALDNGAANATPIRYLASAMASAHALTDTFGTRAWRVDARSNRQGLRFVGEPVIANLPEQLSAPVAPGTIQLPPDGGPIVLLADAQTVGGYPRLGHVISADLPRMAQLRAGDAVHFIAVGPAEAEAARQRRQGEVARLQWALDSALQRPVRNRPAPPDASKERETDTGVSRPDDCHSSEFD